MPRRPLLVVVAALAISLAILVVMGVRVFERDRDALVERFGQQREEAVTEAVRDFVAEVGEIGEDAQLASVLLQSADGVVQAERDLQAIATIKREYMMMFARRGDTTTSVTAFDAPATVAAVATPMVETMLALAERAPGRLHVSPAFGAPDGRFAWLRVVARRIDEASPTVALVVDTAVLLGRMRLGRDVSTRVAVVDARGATALASDPLLVALVARVGPTATHLVIDEALATKLGLPPTRAVAIGVPVEIDPAGPSATLLVVTSMQVLGTQESSIVRRVLVGGTLILVLLVSASAYVLRNTFRARTLRERTHLLERLLHSEKLVTAGQLAAGIAHEVGTPLNVARARVELSLSKLGDDHPIAANQRTAIDQIDRVTRLLQQLLDYVRPAQLALADVDLGRAAHAVRELLSPQAAKRGVTLQVEVTPEVASLRADPDHVQQVVMNLALNAIDACESGGTVVLRTRAATRALVLEVTDDGHGIPSELHQQVFDPFFTTKKRGQGTGLGLWVVAQIVRAQAGEIELTSTSARGTTVRVTWPRSAA